VTLDDYAPISAASSMICATVAFAAYLDPDSYVQSQALAEQLLDAVRWASSIQACAARRHVPCVFAAALVMNVRKTTTYRFRWHGNRHR